MYNFVNDLDNIYGQKKSEIREYNVDNDFCIYIPVTIETKSFSNKNFLIRKSKDIKFLYIKDGCRIYFSDADIINMLLNLKNQKSIEQLILYFEKMYKTELDELETYSIIFEDKRYNVKGYFDIQDTQILLNKQDIDIEFNDLLVLINIILAKDHYVFNSKRYSKYHSINFIKTTCVKYITLLKYYYFDDVKAKLYLENNRYCLDKDIDYNYKQFRNKIERNRIFQNFEEFEKYNV